MIPINSVFFVFGGTSHASWKEKGRYVSRLHCLFKCCKSIVWRIFPFFFGVITIVVHHMTGVPIGTGANIPLRTSLSRLFLTASFRWYGTCIGVSHIWCCLIADVDVSRFSVHGLKWSFCIKCSAPKLIKEVLLQLGYSSLSAHMEVWLIYLEGWAFRFDRRDGFWLITLEWKGTGTRYKARC